MQPKIIISDGCVGHKCEDKVVDCAAMAKHCPSCRDVDVVRRISYWCLFLFVGNG